MLVLGRGVGESILIGDNIRIIISKVKGRQVTIAIDAPKEVKIIRERKDDKPNDK